MQLKCESASCCGLVSTRYSLSIVLWVETNILASDVVFIIYLLEQIVH